MGRAGWGKIILCEIIRYLAQRFLRLLDQAQRRQRLLDYLHDVKPTIVHPLISILVHILILKIIIVSILGRYFFCHFSASMAHGLCLFLSLSLLLSPTKMPILRLCVAKNGPGHRIFPEVRAV